MSLALARKLHFAAQQQVVEGKSPARSKQADKRRFAGDLQLVRGLAEAYIDRHLAKLASSARAEAWIRSEILPTLGLLRPTVSLSARYLQSSGHLPSTTCC